jgi:hypothetical protein
LDVSELKPKDAKAVEEMDAVYIEVFGNEQHEKPVTRKKELGN